MSWYTTIGSNLTFEIISSGLFLYKNIIIFSYVFFFFSKFCILYTTISYILYSRHFLNEKCNIFWLFALPSFTLTLFCVYVCVYIKLPFTRLSCLVFFNLLLKFVSHEIRLNIFALSLSFFLYFFSIIFSKRKRINILNIHFNNYTIIIIINIVLYYDWKSKC